MNYLTFAPVWALLILVIMTLMPTLIYGHGYRGSSKTHAMHFTGLASGAHLVMETQSGSVLVRPAREAVPDQVATLPATATVGSLDGGNKRVKNPNKKSNKSHNKMQNADAPGRRHGLKKSPVSPSEEQLQHGQHGNVKQQRQMLKPQQHEHQHRAGKRSGAKAKASEKAATCRYAKSSWTDCDAKTNMRTRTLSLKKGESHCLPTRTVQKKCKKSCRYEKGSWSECNIGKMTREDKLKTSEDGTQQSCNPSRLIYKNCDPGTAEKLIAGGVRSTKVRKTKEKGTRHTSPQA